MTLRNITRPQNLPPMETLYTTVDGSPIYPHGGLLSCLEDPLPEELLKSDEALREFILKKYREVVGRDERVKRDFPDSKTAVFHTRKP